MRTRRSKKVKTRLYVDPHKSQIMEREVLVNEGYEGGVGSNPFASPGCAIKKGKGTPSRVTNVHPRSRAWNRFRNRVLARVKKMRAGGTVT